MPDRHDLSGAPLSDRLDTWKEVASHLRRSVRTVQRWEREEGLPVHRHRHDKQGSIYAFKHELDQWWTARGAELEPADPAAEPSEKGTDSPVAIVRKTVTGPVRGYRLVVGLGLAALTVAMVAGTGLVRNNPTPASTPTEAKPHRILLAKFQNHTDDPQLGVRLRDAVQDQFGSNRQANVVPANQVAEYLRLMRKPPDTVLDAGIAHEISLRDGAIDAFVIGTIDQVESAYAVSISVLTPVAATVVASFSTEAATPAQLMSRVRRVLDSRRAEIGKGLAHNRRDAPLPRVTTSSLRALELYAEAVNLMDQVPMKTGPAFELLNEAIRLDPGFASAHNLAAWSLRNAGQPQAKVLPHAERAFKLADLTTDAERYFILGSYYQLTLAVDRAIAAYEALLRLDPDNYWALGNLGRLYRTVGRHDAVSALNVRRVAIRPAQFWGNFRLAEALFLQGDLAGAEKYAERAAAQVSEKDPAVLQSRRSWMTILPACKAWLRDDVQGTLGMINDLESKLGERHGADREAMTTSVGYMYLALGLRDAAERVVRRSPQSADRLYHLAVMGSHFGDTREVQDYFTALPDPASASASFHGFPMLDARWAGQTSLLLDKWRSRMDAADLALLRGQVALMGGLTTDAVRLLTESVASREDRHGSPALSASLGIARAIRRSGDAHQAVHVLEEASRNRYASCLWPGVNAHLWVQLRHELAGLYRVVGRLDDAVAVESQLNTLLALADDDYLVKPRAAKDSLRSDR